MTRLVEKSILAAVVLLAPLPTLVSGGGCRTRCTTYRCETRRPSPHCVVKRVVVRAPQRPSGVLGTKTLTLPPPGIEVDYENSPDLPPIEQ